MAEQTGTGKFRFSAGRLVRKEFIRAIKASCFSLDLELEIEEDKSFWDSDFYCKISGPASEILRFKKWYDGLIVANQDDE